MVQVRLAKYEKSNTFQQVQQCITVFIISARRIIARFSVQRCASDPIRRDSSGVRRMDLDSLAPRVAQRSLLARHESEHSVGGRIATFIRVLLLRCRKTLGHHTKCCIAK